MLLRIQRVGAKICAQQYLTSSGPQRAHAPMAMLAPSSTQELEPCSVAALSLRSSVCARRHSPVARQAANMASSRRGEGSDLARSRKSHTVLIALRTAFESGDVRIERTACATGFPPPAMPSTAMHAAGSRVPRAIMRIAVGAAHQALGFSSRALGGPVSGAKAAACECAHSMPEVRARAGATRRSARGNSNAHNVARGPLPDLRGRRERPGGPAIYDCHVPSRIDSGAERPKNRGFPNFKPSVAP